MLLPKYIDVLPCQKGSTVGVKARLSQRSHECSDGKTFTYPEIIAEKITFINTKSDK